MLTKAFWRGAAERALKTFAQSLVAVIGVGAVGLLDVDWIGALSAALLATVISLLTSIGNADFTAGETPVVLDHDGGLAEAISAAYPEASGEPR